MKAINENDIESQGVRLKELVAGHDMSCKGIGARIYAYWGLEERF